MKQWEAFFKRYQLISRITKLMTFLAIAFVLICLVCCMVYSELSAAEDYAAALIGIADEQGAQTGFDPAMTAADMPRIFIDHYDAIKAAVPEAEAREEAGDLLLSGREVHVYAYAQPLYVARRSSSRSGRCDHRVHVWHEAEV